MFESAELGRRIDKQTWDREVPKLREALLDAQYDLKELGKFPVVILIGGVDGAGKGETVNLLNEWLDPRYVHTAAFGQASDEERERPPMWRFWRELPPKGRIGILFGSWYTRPIVGRAYRETGDAELDSALHEIARFERMLVDEGAVLLKFWFHLSKKQQKRRLEKLAESPKTAWRVTELDKRHFKLYDRFRRISEHALRETSRSGAVWNVVEGYDPRYRGLTVGRLLLETLQTRLKQANGKPKTDLETPPAVPATDSVRIVDAIDLSKKLAGKTYDRELSKYQRRLNLLLREPEFKKDRAVVAVFEGVDAAGKSSCIRRITGALDARQYRVAPIAAPSDEEKAQPFLWRFWRQLPRFGKLVVFDRSWYGRVLVERVEGFCSQFDWTRAYHEINDFEQQLREHGTILVKFWLQISKKEQMARFRAREKTGYKRFKITPEDWRNRDKWEEYETAVCDMVDRTSTEISAWNLISAEDKKHARIEVLKTICRAVERGLKK